MLVLAQRTISKLVDHVIVGHVMEPGEPGAPEALDPKEPRAPRDPRITQRSI